jgi:YceI-like domain
MHDILLSQIKLKINRLHLTLLIICLLFNSLKLALGQEKLYVSTSNLTISSEATLELITATSKEMRGIIDTKNKTFAFTVASASFQGFNSPLQKNHFDENYMESEKFPMSKFTGKIVDEVDFNKPGTYSVRVKGMLTIRGISNETIFRSTIIVKDNGIEINSEFSIYLDDYNIRIPRVVYQKISPEIKILLNVNLKYVK